jgi:spore coat polysaccharide biosynthesis protein SpsF
MAKVIGTITARMSSTRLPGKVLREIEGKTMFEHVVERTRQIKGLDDVFLATSKDTANSELIKEAERIGCKWYAGAEQDIVGRVNSLCKKEGVDAIIRISCDTPLFDIESAGRFVSEFKKKYHDYIYVSNLIAMYGTLSELISYKALLEVHKHYHGPAMSIYIRENMEKFKILGIEIDHDLCRPEYRMTVDYPVDLDLIRHIYKGLYKGTPILLRDVYTWLDDHPEIAKINSDVKIKDVNLYAESLVQKPLYSIAKSGDGFVVLDEQKKPVKPAEFVNLIAGIFPELKGIVIN